MRALLAVPLLPVLLLLAGCSSDDDPTVPATATTTTAPISAPTTIDDGPDATPVADVCALLDDSLRATGLIVAGAPEQQLTPTTDGCEWGLISLGIRSDVDSSAFEEAVAALPGDPTTVDALGEMAVSGDSLVIAYESGHLVTVSGHEVMSDEQLVPLAREILTRL